MRMIEYSTKAEIAKGIIQIIRLLEKIIRQNSEMIGYMRERR